MRSLCLMIALLPVLISGGAAMAADQQDDKSYLPPAAFRAAPSPGLAGSSQRAALEQPRRKQVRAGRRYREAHGYRERRSAGPRFLFGFF